ncbi:UNVERIFIED_CONTAM: hypothetical protein FKN15_075416 [Acipenser sinensis]
MISSCVCGACTAASWYCFLCIELRGIDLATNTKRNIFNAFTRISCLTIVAAQADRCHFGSEPLRYRQRISPLKTMLIVVCLWIMPLAVFAVQTTVTHGTLLKIECIAAPVCSVITFLIMIVLNIKLLMIVNTKAKRRVSTHQNSLILIATVSAWVVLIWSPQLFCTVVLGFKEAPFQLMRRETVPLSAFLLPVFSAGITPVLYVRWCSQLAKASSVKPMHQLHRRER